MQATLFSRTAVAVISLTLLVSCGEDFAGANSFQARYSSARDALEKGDYQKASRAYGKLLDQAGPLRPRLQLEYAHSELRLGNYASAARLAGEVAQTQKGDARGAALSVFATAQHELALLYLEKGETYAAKPLLKSARSAMAEVVKSYPELDPLNAMSARKAAIDAQLKRL